MALISINSASTTCSSLLIRLSWCASAMIIGNIRRESSTERALSEHDHVIETLAANGTNEPFDIGSLPGRARCGKHLFNAHSVYLIHEVLPEDSIPIAH